MPKLAGKKPAPMPEIVKKHFIAKPGYVNYFFNEKERERVWSGLVSRGNYADCQGLWTLTGLTGAEEEFRLEFSGEEAAIKLPAGELRVELTGGLSSHLEPPGSGGLLTALSLWRRLLVDGPDKFGRVTYLGTMPLVDRDGLYDVLSAAHDDVECLFYCNPTNGELVALEMTPEIDADPCELYFDHYQEFAGHWLPSRIEVRHGDGYGYLFLVKHYEFNTEEQKDGK